MKGIKRIILSVAATLTATDISFAQTYGITPNDTISITGIIEDIETLSIQQVNLTSDTIHLQWKKISQTLPANWDANVCDNAMCYGSLEDTGKMNPVLAGEYGLLLLHITPHVNYGTAVVRYAVWNVASPLLKDTLTYVLNVSDLSGMDKTSFGGFFSTYPNPGSNQIHVVSNGPSKFTFSIADISGRQILSGVSENRSVEVSTSNLQNGIYVISITDEDRRVTPLKIVIKH